VGLGECPEIGQWVANEAVQRQAGQNQSRPVKPEKEARFCHQMRFSKISTVFAKNKLAMGHAHGNSPVPTFYAED
jgi:hypothetical protein